MCQFLSAITVNSSVRLGGRQKFHLKKQWKTCSITGGNAFSTNMKAVVILPTYNERDNIEQLLDRLRNAAQKITNHTLVYLVVDDSSPDQTGKIVTLYQKKYTDVYLLTGKKEGLGKALLRGMTYAVEELNAQIIVQIDADLSHDPDVLPDFFKALDQGADFVVGSRYIPGGSIPGNWGIHRKIFSVVGNAIVRFGLGYPRVHDWTGGYRAYSKKYFDLARHEISKYSGYVFQIAFLHKSIQHGANIYEVPIQFTDRRFGHSKIAPSEYIRNVLLYVARQRMRRLKHGHFGKFMVVGIIGFIINTIGLEAFVYLGLHPALSSALGAELAIISNFTFNNKWTFKERSVHGMKKLHKFLQFNLTGCGAIVIQAITVWTGTHLLGRESYRLFYMLGILIAMFWNYTMYSKVIWKHTESPSRAT